LIHELTEVVFVVCFKLNYCCHFVVFISAYQITYGDALVWQPYRRNHKGSIPPEKTRKTCIVCMDRHASHMNILFSICISWRPLMTH